MSDFLSKVRVDKRFLLLLGIIIYVILFFSAFIVFDDNVLMRAMGVPVQSEYSFLDLRSLTSAFSCTAEGYDVYISNPCDPANRVFNYPRAWLGLGFFGFRYEHTLALGFLIAITFFLTFIFLFLKKINNKEAILYLFALVSTIPIFALERGNIDVVIFIILVIACYLFRKSGEVYNQLGYILIFIAAVLKIFPVLAFIVILKEPPRKRIIIGSFLGISSALYFALTYNDLALINGNTPKGFEWSYGSRVLIDRYYAFLLQYSTRLISYFPLFLIIISLLSALILAIKSKRDYLKNSTYLNEFRIGAAIYLGSFVLGNNWDYRLIFLLFCIPQLLEWSKSAKEKLSFSLVTLVLIFLTLWAGFWLKEGSVILVFLEEGINWLIFIFFVFFTLKTFPEEFKNVFGLAKIAKP